MGNLKLKEEISREIKMSNENDENRRYDIEGTVRLSYGAVVDVSSITAKLGVRVIANARTSSGVSAGPGMQQNTAGVMGINGTFYGDADNPNSEIMTEIENFVADVKAYDFDAESTEDA